MKDLPPDYDIRYSQPEDLEVLQNWFSDLEERKPFPFETDEETAMALKNWIGFAKYKASLTAVVGEKPCGVGTLFLMPYRKVAHHCSFYLIVDPKMRRRGIGTSLMRNLIHLAQTRFRLESMHVEFIEPSGLSTLLQKLGFVEFARQENFMKIDGQGRTRVLMEHFYT